MSDSPYITADEILCTALDVGEHILRHGGEVYRVEDTINRICISYGILYKTLNYQKYYNYIDCMLAYY